MAHVPGIYLVMYVPIRENFSVRKTESEPFATCFTTVCSIWLTPESQFKKCLMLLFSTWAEMGSTLSHTKGIQVRAHNNTTNSVVLGRKEMG